MYYFLGSLFTIHYKKGHYSLIIIPQPDPHVTCGHNIIYDITFSTEYQ